MPIPAWDWRVFNLQKRMEPLLIAAANFLLLIKKTKRIIFDGLFLFCNYFSAIEAFPGVENQEEVREAFQHHEAFAFRTSHLFLPGLVAMLWAAEARARPDCLLRSFNNLALHTSAMRSKVFGHSLFRFNKESTYAGREGDLDALKEGAYFDRDVRRPSVDNASLNGEAPGRPEASR